MTIKQWYLTIRNTLRLIFIVFLMLLGHCVCRIFGHKYQDVNNGKFKGFKECKRCGELKEMEKQQ